MPTRIRTAEVKYDAFKMEGGLDLVTPTLSLKPGVARSAVNFEVSVAGGYTRIAGYERHDGRVSPSTAVFEGVEVDNISAAPAVGSDLHRNGSGTPIGVVLAIDGNWIYFANISAYVGAGAFTQFSVGNTCEGGTVTAVAGTTGSQYLDALYTSQAADYARTYIGQVPGEGPVRGVAPNIWAGSGFVYAWRNNVGSTAMNIYKSTTSGWQLVSLGNYVTFNTGALGAIVAGDTITDSTTGGTAVVKRVMLESGTTWIGGSGKLILGAITGTIGSGNALQVGGTTRATATSAGTAITLAPGGRVQTVLGTFGNNATTRIYGCDGVNKGFELSYEGGAEVYCPITTGMATDTPTNVALHKNFLFFSFGPSVQNSGIGTPYVWTPVLGANEFVLPENVTSLLTLPGTVASGALGVFTRNNTYLLYGTGTDTWNLVPFNAGIGAGSYTAQNMENAYALDDRGVVSLQSSQNFGNFDSATLTLPIRPFVQQRRTLATASALNREKSQYRVFYSDGYGLYCTIANGKMMGAMPVYFNDPVFCWSEEDSNSSNGAETSYYGGTNTGYVYKMDTGTSFDGAKIYAQILLNYNPSGNARILKRYRRASVEVTGTGYADFNFGYSLAYGSLNLDQAGVVAYAAPVAPSEWDSFDWDSFIWDGTDLAPVEVQCVGTGENLALMVNSYAAYCAPFTVNSAIVHYSPRRGIR